MIIAQHEVPTAPRLYGPADEFWKYKGREAMLAGPFDTGKTFAVLLKLHALLVKYGNSRAFITRQTYKSLLSTAIVTWENKILPVHPDRPDSPIRKYGKSKPEFYEYPNGSHLLVVGMDNPDKILSGEFDFGYVNQAEEILLDVWEILIGRCTGRAGNAPYTQVMGDCNPSHPQHWILARKELRVFEQLHRHNPTIYNQETGELLESGKERIAALQSLTGIRYQRGYLGQWVSAEGVIYDNFMREYNVRTEAEYDPSLPVIWGVDDGYVRGEGRGTVSYHPRVILFCQMTAQGGLNIFDEYVMCGEVAELSIQNALEKPYPLPDTAYVDSSAAELKARLWDTGIQTIGGTHKVDEGIKNMQRMVCDGNGVRLLLIHPRCVETTYEIQSYKWAKPPASGGEPKPEKVDDHCMDAARYVAWSQRFE